jgi:hypothetical protein
MRGVATKQYLNTTARSNNDAAMPFPAQRSRLRIDPSALSRRLEGSLQTQLSPSFLASGSILSRREAIEFSDRA